MHRTAKIFTQDLRVRRRVPRHLVRPSSFAQRRCRVTHRRAGRAGFWGRKRKGMKNKETIFSLVLYGLLFHLFKIDIRTIRKYCIRKYVCCRIP